MPVRITLSARTRGSFLAHSKWQWTIGVTEYGIAFSSYSVNQKAVSYNESATASFWDETLLSSSQCCVVSQWCEGPLFQREKHMVLIVPESASRKNECRKLLLPFTSLHLNQNLFLCLGFVVVVIFVWFFVWLGVFCFLCLFFVCLFAVLLCLGFILWKRSPGEDERIAYMCN